MQDQGTQSAGTMNTQQGAGGGSGQGTTSPGNQPVNAIGNPGGSIDKVLMESSRQVTESAKQRLSEAAHGIQEKSHQVLDGATRYVQGYPLRSVVFAAALGVVVGILIGDRGVAKLRHLSWLDRF